MLLGKSAFIIGATGGLCYAIAERLAADDCDVVINGLAADADMADGARLP